MEASSEAPAIFRRRPTTSTGQPVASRIGTNFEAGDVPRSTIRTRRLQTEAEVAMTTTTTTNHPPKHLVREYLERRSKDTKPPPTPEEIRRQLGWGMLMPSDDRIGASRS
jgi:hypothetical protein